MDMDNTIHFRYSKSLSNDVTVYLDTEKIDISQVQIVENESINLT